MEKNKRKAVFTPLKEFCVFAKDDAFIEVVEWANTEGFDVTIETYKSESFSLSYGQFKALKKVVKELQKWND